MNHDLITVLDHATRKAADSDQVVMEDQKISKTRSGGSVEGLKRYRVKQTISRRSVESILG